MNLVITNVFNDHVSRIAGSPVEVEGQLRDAFPGLLDDIPKGDLNDVLRAVNRMYGYSVVIIDSSDHVQPPRPHAKRPVNDDPWEREGDE